MGCGDGSAAEGGAGGPSAASITGSLVDVHVTEGGDIEQPVDPALVSVAALLPGDGGGFTSIEGSVGEDGRFSIPDVPEGTYYLAITTGAFVEIVVTSARSLDLGFVFAGRPDASAVFSTPTNLVLDVDQMSPWQDGDHLEIFSLGAGTYGDLASTTEAPPSVGATALTGMASDAFLFASPMLVDGEQGDVATITHITAREAGGSGAPLPYSAVVKAFTPAPFVQVDGEPTQLSGSFEDVAQSDIAIDWKRSLWSAAIKDANPAAEVESHDILVYAEPGGAERSTSSYSPTLLATTDVESTDVTLSMSYGNPFPSGWGVVANVNTFYSVSVTVPGSGETRKLGMSMGVSAPIDAFMAGPIEPALTPVRDVTINGKAAYETMTGVGASPTVSFSPPATGTPSAYAVFIRRVDPMDSSLVATVAVVRTESTTVTIPPGILEKGTYYYLRIASETGRDLDVPHKARPDSAYAEAVTGLIAP